MIKKEIIISGLKVSYLISADFNPNQAIVFLPGWKSPVDLFCSIMGDTPNLLAVNLPGWGGSEKAKATWGLKEYAVFVKEFLQRLGINKPVLIGHSIGGTIAVEYLSQGGEAQKLIIISGAIIREKSVKVKALMMGAKIFRFCLPFINKKWRARLAGQTLSPDYVQAGELEEVYKKVIGEDRQEVFSRLKLPIILIWGRDDKDTPYAQAEKLSSLQPLAILEPIIGAGHYCFLDQPQKFREAIIKFL